ncbi:cytochrome P450 [Ganoderma leucocontextum]|nr:cytochrome P450 [Ganoderma leucocontextum]
MIALEGPQALILASVALLVAFCIVRWKTHPLRSIPTVGGSDAPGLSILTWLNFLRNGEALIQKGYQKYHGSTFKIALFDRWLVVVSGSKMVDELRSRPDSEVSFLEGIEEIVQMKYIIGHEALDDQYHVGIIKEKLTRMLPAIVPDVVDELKLAVSHYIPTKGNEWTAVSVVTTMQKIVARVSNRAFLGLQLCRNENFLQLAIHFTVDVIKDSVIMAITPYSFKTLIGQLLSSARRTMGQAMQHIRPVINERKASMKAFGEDWSDKPNDVLQWIIDEAVRRNQSDVSILERIFLVNFAAIHTSSNSITHVLYDLAAMPECIQPLREEIEAVVATDGWSKAAIDKMRKLDSIFRESSRYHGISLIALPRKVTRDITLNDGTFVPKGTVLAAAARPAHHDEANYVNADVFDPFRFAKMREREGESAKHQFVKTSVDLVSFGHGRHACPGRFFAASVLKAMLAYIILNYDLKLAGDGKRPANLCFSGQIIPSPTGQVLFRKRQAASW